MRDLAWSVSFLPWRKNIIYDLSIFFFHQITDVEWIPAECEGNLNKPLQKTWSTGAISLSLHIKEAEIQFDHASWTEKHCPEHKRRVWYKEMYGNIEEN